MDSKETHKQQEPPPHGMLTGSCNRNTAALMGSTSTPQAMHHETLQPLMQLGKEKRGRGRPRKYAPAPPAKRARGRPPLNNKPNALERSLKPHIINVKAGEDIAAKIVEFTQQGPLEVCILSASGAVSSAMLLHSNNPNNPTGVVKYEGPYEIIGMSGSFLNTVTRTGNLSVSLANHNGNSIVTRPGNLSVSLANHNDNIVGGFVAGMLIAGSQVKVVVGSFTPERVNQSAGRVENNPEPASASAPASVLTLSGGPGRPHSQGTQHLKNDSINNNNHHQMCDLRLWPGNDPQ